MDYPVRYGGVAYKCSTKDYRFRHVSFAMFIFRMMHLKV